MAIRLPPGSSIHPTVGATSEIFSAKKSTKTRRMDENAGPTNEGPDEEEMKRRVRVYDGHAEEDARANEVVF